MSLKDKIERIDKDSEHFKTVVAGLCVIREYHQSEPMTVSCGGETIEIKDRMGIGPLRNMIKDFEYTLAILERNKKELLLKGN